MSIKKPLERGDIVYMDFAPVVGAEMDFNRPAIIISPASFNALSNLIFVCPITSTIRNSPWEVKLPQEMRTRGVVRVDHLKSVDKSRCEMLHHRIVVKEKAPNGIIEEILAKLETLVT